MAILRPSSIGVIGASASPGKVGHDILKNLLTQGYGGTVYPINPKGGTILDANVYASVSDVPEAPELAIIVIPAAHVPVALRECGQKGVKNVMVISAGFGEVHTDEGDSLEQELQSIAQEYDITLIGPNCLGIVRPHQKMNASFAKELPPAGGVGIISQSGAMGVALMDGARENGLGLSAFISIGNKTITDETDVLQWLADDDDTSVIGLYLESFRDGRHFLETAMKVLPKKPIVLLKAGVSTHGRKAAASHTGALAGNDRAIDALCAQAGIHRAQTTEEFLDLLAVLSTQPTLASHSIAIVTNAGGPGILATDAAETAGLSLPDLNETSRNKLTPALPAAASVANPIDVIGDADAARYTAAIDACLDDPAIDGVVVLLTPQVMTPCAEVAKEIVRLHKSAPLIPITCAFMGGESVRESVQYLRDNGVPCFPTPERAVRAMASLQLQKQHPFLGAATHETHPMPTGRQARRDASIKLLQGHSGLLNEHTTQQLFALYNLPLPKQDIAKSADDAVRIANAIGYPVIAKISSPEILHKTDVGGVRANLKNESDVRAAFTEIMQNASSNTNKPNNQITNQPVINGVLIQQFLPAGNEFIVGAIRDPSFGPLIMVGLGGIYTELFADTSFRIAPVTQEDAYQMLTELKAWKLLLGMRGKAQSDIDALALLITKISHLMIDCPMVKELDLNPVLVTQTATHIADAKVVL